MPSTSGSWSASDCTTPTWRDGHALRRKGAENVRLFCSQHTWDGRNCTKEIRAHRGSLNTIFTDSHQVVTGGKDCKVRLWTYALEPGATFDLSAYGLNPIIRSVCMSRDGTRLLVGTKGCEIFEINAADGSDLHRGPITASHYAGGAHGLAIHPLKPEYVTTGDDGTVRIWDMTVRNMLKSTDRKSVV